MHALSPLINSPALAGFHLFYQCNGNNFRGSRFGLHAKCYISSLLRNPEPIEAPWPLNR
jgi:hypothetical protein